MDAHFTYRVCPRPIRRQTRPKWVCGIAVMLLLTTGAYTVGASYETANFSVNAPTADSAEQFAEKAEQCRRDLAVLWLGKTLPDWSAKCPVVVFVGNDLGAGGKTSFVFENGEVFGWEMEIQGPHNKILDSVLPHEITHMILASHFRKPIPRWLDEGMATSVEHPSEKENYHRMLRRYLQPNVRKCLPLNQMVAMKDYPSDPMPFYAQGLSLIEYLLESGRQFDAQEHHRLIQFTQSAMQSGDWQSALREQYNVQNLGELSTNWLAWVDGGAVNGGVRATAAVGESMIAETLPPESEWQQANVPVASVSAKPVSAQSLPPYGKSVYDHRTKATSLSPTIPVTPIPVTPAPASLGREVILR